MPTKSLPPPRRLTTNVGLFVDWNSQLRQAPRQFEHLTYERSQYALKRVGKIATKLLCELDQATIFRVSVRLYHGWTSGTNQTENRRQIVKCPEFEYPDDLFPSTRVLALGDIGFGDRLLDALPQREVTGSGIHLPNTYRRQSGKSDKAEKMVDTALASDLLSWARSQPKSLAIVMSEDDDAVPPLYVAESWMVPAGGRILLSRGRPEGESRYLKLRGLCHE